MRHKHTHQLLPPVTGPSGKEGDSLNLLPNGRHEALTLELITPGCGEPGAMLFCILEMGLAPPSYSNSPQQMSPLNFSTILVASGYLSEVGGRAHHGTVNPHLSTGSGSSHLTMWIFS